MVDSCILLNTIKTLNEYFKTFTKGTSSAVDDNGNELRLYS